MSIKTKDFVKFKMFLPLITSDQRAEVWIDDKQITGIVRSVKIESGIERLTTVTLELIGNVEIEGESKSIVRDVTPIGATERKYEKVL